MESRIAYRKKQAEEVENDLNQIPTQPLIIMASSGQQDKTKYCTRAAIALAVAQIICGGLAAGASAGLYAVGSNYSSVGTGLWCGVVMIVAGSVQIVAGISKKKCLITITLVAEIFAALFAIPILVVSSVEIQSEGYVQGRHYSTGNYYGTGYYDHKPDMLLKRDAIFPLRIMLVVIANVAGMIAMISLAMACVPVFCRNSNSKPAMTLTPAEGNQYVLRNQPAMIFPEGTGPSKPTHTCTFTFGTRRTEISSDNSSTYPTTKTRKENQNKYETII